jgi:hypothetical protein
MNKNTKIIIFTSIIFLALVVIAPICFIIIGFASFENRVENWNVEKEKWQKVEVNIDNFNGKAYIMTKQTHPYFAEFDYKLSIRTSNINKEFDLDNGEGKVNVQIYLIEDQGDNYLQVRNITIDLEKLEKANLSNSIDNKKLIGNVSLENGKLVYTKID